MSCRFPADKTSYSPFAPTPGQSGSFCVLARWPIRPHGQQCNLQANITQLELSHPDTQAIFISVAAFNALTKSDTNPRVSRPFPSMSRLPPIPEHTTVIGQYYFRFERNNAMNSMETIDGEPCICI
jgi:hypothetical protein